MKKQLPVEALKNAFLLLHLKDKVECMRTCKAWRTVIEEHCLLETIRIASMAQVERILKKVQADPIRAQQVERIFFSVRAEKDYNVGHFFNQFPNLRVVFMSDSQATQFPGISQNTRIERIFDGDSHAMSTYFLRSPGCSNIKELLINEHAIDKGLPLDAIDLFDSYPVLTMLTVSDITIPLHKLESLHNAAPALKSLSLTSVTMTVTDALPATIKPASSLNALIMSMSDRAAIDTQIKYLEYAAKKYPNIMELTYLSNDFEDVDPGLIQPFYEQGLIPFIQPIASQLKKHEVSLPNVPAALADMLHQIKLNHKPYQIDFTDQGANDELKRLVDSQQAKTLEQLQIIFDEEKLDFASILKEFTSLKKLEIHCLGLADITNLPIVDMKDILEGVPDTLESLMVAAVPIEDIYDGPSYSNIKELHFSSCMFDKGLDVLIGSYFPGLTSLTMDSCCISQKKLNLSDLNLQYLQLKDVSYLRDDLLFGRRAWCGEKEMNIYIKTARHKNIYMTTSHECLPTLNQYYDHSNAEVHPHIKVVPFHQNDKINVNLTITVNSVKDVVLSNSGSGFPIDNTYFEDPRARRYRSQCAYADSSFFGRSRYGSFF